MKKPPENNTPLQMMIDPKSSDRLQIILAKQEYSYGKFGILIGLVCILGGIILFISGIVGSTTWTVSLLGIKSTMTDAPPGIALFFIGLIFVFVTRPKFTHK